MLEQIGDDHQQHCYEQRPGMVFEDGVWTPATESRPSTSSAGGFPHAAR